MRLEMLRTAKPELAGGAWYVVDNDAGGARIYNPVFVGTAAECGQYIDDCEGGRTPKPQTRFIPASKLGPGEVIVNVGTVFNSPRTEGAFVHVDIRTERWSPVAGVQNVGVETRFFHCTDDVMVVA